MRAIGTEGNADFGRLGANPFIEYFNDMMSATTAFWQEQAMGWAGLVQRMMETPAAPAQTARETNANDAWQRWLSLFTSPVWWLTRYQAEAPTVLLVAESQAEMAGPSVAQTLVSVPDGAQVEVTDLQRIGTGASLPRTHLDVQLLPGGNRVEVKLVNLGNSAERKARSGLFAAVVYAKEQATRRPLAFVVAYIEEPGRVPAPPGQPVTAGTNEPY